MNLSDSLGMLNSAIQFAGAQMGAVRDKKFIRQENEKARQFQLEMWNKANEYNLPSAQMQRLQDAGLNPNLVYGDGAKTLAEYASSPGHSAPNMNTGALYSNAASGFLQGIMAKSNLEVNNSIIAKNKADAAKSTQEAAKIGEEGSILKDSHQALVNINTNTAEKLVQDKFISQYQANILMNESDYSDYWRQTTFTYVDSNGEELELVGWQLDVLKAMEALKNLEFNNSQIKAVIGKLGAETRSIYKDIEVKDETIKLMSTQEFMNMVNADVLRSTEYLNFVLSAKYGTEASAIKQMLPFQMWQTGMDAQLKAANINLTNEQKDQVIIDTYNAMLNGRLDRYLKSSVQRYGNSTMGTILNVMYDGIQGLWNEGTKAYNKAKTKVKDLYNKGKDKAKSFSDGLFKF